MISLDLGASTAKVDIPALVAVTHIAGKCSFRGVFKLTAVFKVPDCGRNGASCNRRAWTPGEVDQRRYRYTYPRRERHTCANDPGRCDRSVEWKCEMLGFDRFARNRPGSTGVGQGATFVVSLPILAVNSVEGESRDQTGADCRTLSRDALKLKGLRVLVVDDEADARDLVRRFLIDCEAIPELAASAEEAESLLSSFKPNVIISDIGMPDQDGYAFMRGVRRKGLTTPALALTAFARDEDRASSIQAGYQMHLRKPVDPAELIAAVANLAGR